MNLSVSGSVRINTRLDNSQLMKDCRALKTVVTEVANAVKRAFHGREIQALEQQMEATREAMSPIVQELTEIENRASAAGKILRGISRKRRPRPASCSSSMTPC